MDSKQLFARSVEEAAGCVLHVKADQLTNATPCSEWDLRALLNHMVYELLWVPDLLSGKTVHEVGDKYDGDVLKGDHVRAWEQAVDGASAAIHAADLEATVHLSYGDVKAKNYIAEMAQDMMIHGWDVGQSVNCSLVMDKAAAQTMYEHTLPRKEEMRTSGLFGTPLDVAQDADIQTKLLALMGRSADWQKTHEDQNR